MATFADKIKAVMGLLKASIRGDDINENYAAIVLPQNPEYVLGFYLSGSHGKGKIEIRGDSIRAKDGWQWDDPFKCAIGVSESRSAAAIATEIERRLLPELLPVYDECIKKRDTHQIFLNRMRAAQQEIADILGFSLKEKLDARAIDAKGSDKGFFRDLHVSDTSVNIHMDGIPLELAKKMLKVWAEG